MTFSRILAIALVGISIGLGATSANAGPLRFAGETAGQALGFGARTGVGATRFAGKTAGSALGFGLRTGAGATRFAGRTAGGALGLGLRPLR